MGDCRTEYFGDGALKFAGSMFFKSSLNRDCGSHSVFHQFKEYGKIECAQGATQFKMTNSMKAVVVFLSWHSLGPCITVHHPSDLINLLCGPRSGVVILRADVFPIRGNPSGVEINVVPRLLKSFVQCTPL
jgi:hypothetical protein